MDELDIYKRLEFLSTVTSALLEKNARLSLEVESLIKEVEMQNQINQTTTAIMTNQTKMLNTIIGKI